MNKTPGEAVKFAAELADSLTGCKSRVMIAPSFTSLAAVAEAVKGSTIVLGAQNMADEESGAFTGETSVLMLKEIGVEIVILGHSERRHVYGETDELINKKLKLALKHGLEADLCVGETLEEREAGKADEVVCRQTEKGLAGISEKDLASVTIAYEPVWAIGTGKTATPDDAEAVHNVIRRKIAELYSPEAAGKIIIQYGGSVKPGNVKELMAMEDIDGALVGGAALKAETFVPIAEYDK